MDRSRAHPAPPRNSGCPLRQADSTQALLRLAGGCASRSRFRSNSGVGRTRRAGTCSLLLQFCTHVVCSRWRTRRGKNPRLVRFVSQSTPDTATSSRNEFLQSGRSWTGIGTGLSDLDSGVRLGYQISRKFAPYIGFTYSSSFGQTATFARSAGESVHVSSLVFGVWIWR